MASVEFLIFYKPGEKNSKDFLDDYTKKIRDKAAMYGVKIQVVNITQISRAQSISLQDYIRRNVYPFAFAINGNSKTVYTNIEQIYELIVVAINSAKSARSQKTGSGSGKVKGSRKESYDDYGSVDFLEMQRQRGISGDDTKEDSMAANKGDVYGGDLYSSMVTSRSGPVQGSGNPRGGVPDNSFDKDPSRLDYDPSEYEMISKLATDYDAIDLDLQKHLNGTAMIDPGQEEMMGGANADKLNPSGLF